MCFTQRDRSGTIHSPKPSSPIMTQGDRTMTIERRKFLAATAATGAALSLTDAATAAAVQGANERLRVGVMGTGGRGTGLATSFQRLPNVDVTFVCDVDRGRADAA